MANDLYCPPNLEVAGNAKLFGSSDITRPRLNNFKTRYSAAAIAGGVLTLDFNLNGGSGEFDVALNANFATLTLSNVPSEANFVIAVTIRFTNDGTLRTGTWPASWHWSSNTPPPFTGTLNKVDIVTARSYGVSGIWYPVMYTQDTAV